MEQTQRKIWWMTFLTPAEWDKIYDFQRRRCFICLRKIEPPSRPHTDHNHTSGLLRGILCSSCNRALGQVEDPRWKWGSKQLIRAAFYLLKPPAVEALGRQIITFPGRIGTKRYKKWLKNRK